MLFPGGPDISKDRESAAWLDVSRAAEQQSNDQGWSQRGDTLRTPTKTFAVGFTALEIVPSPNVQHP